MIMKQRIVEYDYVRAVAVLLVILGHCSYYKIMTDYGGVNYGIDPYQTLSSVWIGRVTATLYCFHMPLFVALSGCMFSMTVAQKGVQPFRLFAKKKAIRLLIPFLFVALFWSIPLKYASGYWDGSATDVLRQIFLGQILMYGNYNSHLWYLLAIFNVFLLAFIVEKYNLRKNPQAFFCVLIVLSVAGRLCGHHMVGITESMSYLVWFYVGFYFERCRERINHFICSHVGWIIVVVTIIIFAVMVSAHSHLPKMTGIGSIGYATYYPLALMGMFATYVLCYKLLQITPPYY